MNAQRTEARGEKQETRGSRIAGCGLRGRITGKMPVPLICGLWSLFFGLLMAASPWNARAEEGPVAPPTTVSAPVTSGTEIPAPATTPRFRDGKQIFNLIAAPNTQPNIDFILAQIKAQTGITVTPMGAARAQAIPAPLLKDTTIEDALKWICAQKDWVWSKDGPNYIICDRPYYEKNILSKTVVQRVIVPKNIPAAEAARAVERMKSPVGDIQADPRTNQVFVTDLLPVVEAIERTIKLLDQKVFLRVFTLKHADLNTVMTLIQPYKSQMGRLDPVPKMRQIIAEDTYENIQRMEVMVDLLDRGPEMRIYDLNNIDFEGKSIEDLREYIEKDIVTEGAYLKFDKENGVMILIDLPSVHEKVKKILEAVDRPARQVYIQAEIVETNYSHTFEIGTEFKFGENLADGTAATGNPPTQPAGTTGNATGNVGFIEDIANAVYRYNPTLGSSGIGLDYLSRHARIKFTAAMSDNETRVLAQPRILVKNRQSADIMDGGSLPYVTTTYYGGGYGGGYGGYGGYGGTSGYGGYGGYVPSVGSGSVQTGVTLTVDPSIMNNGLIELRITLNNVSGHLTQVSAASQSYDVPQTSNQTLNTVLVVPDGQTRMIGGMIENRETENVAGVPFLKDIPLIGPILFGKKKLGPNSRRTLLMFITPTIIQEKVRKYETPPDESEMTPPTFFEQAAWSAEAVRRAVREAVEETESKYPGFRFPGEEGEEPKKTTGVPAPTVRLEHEETAEPAKLEKPEKPSLPVVEEIVTTVPEKLAEPRPVILEPKLPPPPTSPTLQPKTTAPTTSPTLQPKANAPPTSPTATAKPPAPPKPQKTPAAPTTRTLVTRKPAATTSPTATRKASGPPTSPTVEQKQPPPAAGPEIKPPRPPTPRERPTTATFPTTGTVMLEKGPPEILLSSRSPADLSLPEPSVRKKRASLRAGGPAFGEEGMEASSYEVNVLGEGGRILSALASGERLETPALGTLQIPVETLATAAAPPAAAPPPGVVLPPGMVMQPGMRPMPPLAPGAQPPTVTPLRPAPTRPPTMPYPTPTYGNVTPYGYRPPIMPPGYQPNYPPSMPPGTYMRTPRTR